MKQSPYARFEPDRLVLRDELAIDRTLLANERTLLAYLRSGIALAIAGATILHFAGSGWFHIVGYACLPAGGIAMILGVARFRSMHKTIMCVRRSYRSELSLRDPCDEEAAAGRREPNTE